MRGGGEEEEEEEATFGTFMTSFFKLAKIQNEFLPDAVERQPRYGTSVVSFPHSSSEDITKPPFLQHTATAVFLNRRAAVQYRAARGSPGICHFSFLSSFHE